MRGPTKRADVYGESEEAAKVLFGRPGPLLAGQQPVNRGVSELWPARESWCD